MCSGMGWGLVGEGVGSGVGAGVGAAVCKGYPDTARHALAICVLCLCSLSADTLKSHTNFPGPLAGRW